MSLCPGIHILADVKDGLLARLRVPGGQLSVEKALKIAHAAEKFGNGLIDLTNRANLQIRGIKPESQDALIDYLLGTDLVSKDPVHDRLRNITIDPLAGLMEAELIDCSQLSVELDQALASFEQRQHYSPKLSIVLDGGGPSRIASLPHDFAFVANRKTADQLSFQMFIKGQPTGISLEPETLAPTIIKILESLIPLSAARPISLKHLLKMLGLNALISHVRNHVTLGNVEPEQFLKSNKLTPLIGSCEQKGQGLFAVNLASPSGQLQHFHLEGLAELSQRFGNGQLRLTPWQSIIIPNVDEDHIADVWPRAEALGFLTQEEEQNLRVMSCAGNKGCIHGHFETKQTSLEIRDDLASMAITKPICVHLSACEKGCASREKTDYLVLQRKGDNQITLHVNASPNTKSPGKPLRMFQVVPEIKRLI